MLVLGGDTFSSIAAPKKVSGSIRHPCISETLECRRGVCVLRVSGIFRCLGALQTGPCESENHREGIGSEPYTKQVLGKVKVADLL